MINSRGGKERRTHKNQNPGAEVHQALNLFLVKWIRRGVREDIEAPLAHPRSTVPWFQRRGSLRTVNRTSLAHELELHKSSA